MNKNHLYTRCVIYKEFTHIKKLKKCEGAGWQELIVVRILKSIYREREKKKKKKHIYTHLFYLQIQNQGNKNKCLTMERVMVNKLV